MASLSRTQKIYTNAEPGLALVWVVIGPAGAVALQVGLGYSGAEGWRENEVFVGRHGYQQIDSDWARRDGECDLLPGVDTCWFGAMDSYGRKLWQEARTLGADADEHIFQALEGVYLETFDVGSPA